MIHIAPAVADDMLGAFLKRFHKTAGSIEVRTGPMPANTADADSGTLLVAYALALNPFALTAFQSVELSAAPLTATAVATGVAGHTRVKDANGVVVIDTSVGESIPILDTDSGTNTVTTSVVHNLPVNAPITVVEDGASTSVLYALPTGPATLQVATSPGGSPEAVPSSGTLIAAYIRAAYHPVSIGAPGGIITLGDDVILHDLGLGV